MRTMHELEAPFQTPCCMLYAQAIHLNTECYSSSLRACLCPASLPLPARSADHVGTSCWFCKEAQKVAYI